MSTPSASVGTLPDAVARELGATETSARKGSLGPRLARAVEVVYRDRTLWADARGRSTHDGEVAVDVQQLAGLPWYPAPLSSMRSLATMTALGW